MTLLKLSINLTLTAMFTEKPTKPLDRISKTEILGKIESDRQRMTEVQERLWNAIKIEPTKWRQDPWGNDGAGFWVVGVIGKTVIWYNDIEDGFNLSNYNQYGVIDEYFCNQDDLEHTLCQILAVLQIGENTGLKLGAPKSI